MSQQTTNSKDEDADESYSTAFESESKQEDAKTLTAPNSANDEAGKSDNNVESTSNPDESTQKEIDEIRRDLNATKEVMATHEARLGTIEEEVGEIQTELGIRTRWTEKENGELKGGVKKLLEGSTRKAKDLTEIEWAFVGQKMGTGRTVRQCKEHYSKIVCVRVKCLPAHQKNEIGSIWSILGNEWSKIAQDFADKHEVELSSLGIQNWIASMKTFLRKRRFDEATIDAFNRKFGSDLSKELYTALSSELKPLLQSPCRESVDGVSLSAFESSPCSPLTCDGSEILPMLPRVLLLGTASKASGGLVAPEIDAGPLSPLNPEEMTNLSQPSVSTSHGSGSTGGTLRKGGSIATTASLTLSLDSSRQGLKSLDSAAGDSVVMCEHADTDEYAKGSNDIVAEESDTDIGKEGAYIDTDMAEIDTTAPLSLDLISQDSKLVTAGADGGAGDDDVTVWRAEQAREYDKMVCVTTPISSKLFSGMAEDVRQRRISQTECRAREWANAERGYKGLGQKSALEEKLAKEEELKMDDKVTASYLSRHRRKKKIALRRRKLPALSNQLQPRRHPPRMLYILTQISVNSN